MLVRLCGGGFGSGFGLDVRGGRGGATSMSGFGFGVEEGAEDQFVGGWIEFGGFGEGMEQIDDTNPVVTGGNVFGGGDVGGFDAGFFIFERAELFAEGDPFIQIMREGMGGVFGVEANFIGNGADFGGQAGGQLIGLAAFGAIGFLGGGEAVGDELITQFEEIGAVVRAEQGGNAGENGVDAANEVVMAGVDIGLFLADFVEARVIGDGLGGGGNRVMGGIDAGQQGGEVGIGDDGLMGRGLRLDPRGGEGEHLFGKEAFSRHGGLLGGMEWTDSLVGELSIWGGKRQGKKRGARKKVVVHFVEVGCGRVVEGWLWVDLVASGDVARQSREALARGLGP